MKTEHGGTRQGAGRPKLTPSVEVCNQELVFPAICSAFHAQPADGTYCAHLTIHLSKTDIRVAYGQEGLDTFQRFFKQVKKGGISQNKTAFNTRWEVPLGVYSMVQMFCSSFGYTLKDLPKPGFPPTALIRRVEEANKRKAAREMEKAQTRAARIQTEVNLEEAMARLERLKNTAREALL